MLEDGTMPNVEQNFAASANGTLINGSNVASTPTQSEIYGGQAGAIQIDSHGYGALLSRPQSRQYQIRPAT
jgi:hypothetical protein